MWKELEEKALFHNTEVDQQWPCEKEDNESESYPYPYQIVNAWDWKQKDNKEIEETFEDQQNVKFQVLNEFNVSMKKQEIEFDPNVIQLFRVSLSINESRI